MLQRASDLLQENNIEIIQQSKIYETEAWGLEDQPAFLNRVLIVATKLAAQAVLLSLLTVESQMGRIRTKKWEQRCIDIDILFYNEEIINEVGLKVPHPYLHQRRFTLVPLCELEPKLVHPVFNKTMQQLLDECEDGKEVRLFE